MDISGIAWDTPTFDSDEAKFRKIQLEKHNKYRAKHKSPAMTLDDRLNKDAQEHAERLAKAGKHLSKSDKVSSQK